jgi:hypothetical protein
VGEGEGETQRQGDRDPERGTMTKGENKDPRWVGAVTQRQETETQREGQ